MINPQDDLFLNDVEEDLEDDGASNEGWLTSFGDLMSLLLVFFILLMSASKVSTVKFEQVKNAVTGKVQDGEVNLITLAEELNKQIKKADLADKVTVDLTDESVDLVFHESLLFKSGKAEIIEENKAIIHEVIAVLKNIPDYTRITVEGHTDNVPIRSARFRNNWELSSARALVIVQSLEDVGFPGNRLALQGFGSNRPLVPNLDDEGNPIAENQRLNRRVVVRVH
ncbi:OmpA/MotB family protein [Pseudobacteriovorax antillogorgiicola]|uniref:Chemotaxis protein MotB n=1 Tax=Pseudobacteriovorax antillogorgiicola TaxID=1513793 RepID=A0A1Y6B9K7_9BACT|nr:flagellar motor protein MotB [Pseudobacteriovorax antillogorgiicola]TCS57526.1 chemotaxis protein MotB [Pseudobacteriovorax antillogorgiicola]SMF00067.1 chemotaxis protein MotB [Pseudobacteriovorax antillogorgiicola]